MGDVNRTDEELRWSVAQRLEFIEFRLVWEGRINRSDIADRFKIRVQQASADLRLYEQIVPANMIYDRNAKTFVASAHFEPRFLKPLADRQLLQLAAIGGGLVAPRETWFDELPPIGVVPTPRRSVETKTIRWILEAIRSGSVIEIDYQSVRRPEPLRRRIAPHALGHDGVRWHARAWCPRSKEFRDFVLSRISGTGLLGPADIDPLFDREWHEEVEVVLAPNPELAEAARRSIAIEYGIVRSRLRVPTRVALAFYMIQHLDLDLKLAPARQQLVLVNRDELDAACQNARQATKAVLEAAGLAPAKAERAAP